MKLNIIQIISIISVFQALFLSLFLISNKKNRNFNNYLLASILFIFSILVITTFTNSIGVGENFIRYHKIIFILRQSALILGTLVYFYILSIFNQKDKFIIKDILHFIPFLVFVVFLIFYLIPVQKFYIASSNLRYYSSGAILAQNIFYLILPFLNFKSQKIKLRDLIFTNGDASKFWLRVIIVGTVILWIVKLNIFILVDLKRSYNLCPYTTSFYFLTFFFLINILFYISLQKPEIFKNIVKYKNSQLSNDDKEKYSKQLFAYINDYKPYLDPELTLAKLSKLLSIPSRHLSQIINEQTEKNFYDFINYYRIEESKILLKEKLRNEKYISEILFTVGFNSRSSFNTAFKKYTGYTPTDYREKLICVN
jgi:AraC-like DNA-binding protein